MLKRKKISLNEISFQAAIGLIRSTLEKGVNITKVFVDTVGTPETYRGLLMTNFPNGIEFTVTAKADSLFPVVSAASIVAKVTRDRTLNSWAYLENTSTCKISKDFGCGYPSDPKTKKWMENNSDPVFGYPNLVRFSWKTTTNFLKGKVCTLKWENYEEDEDPGKTRQKYVDPEKQSKLNFAAESKSVKVDFFQTHKIKYSKIDFFK
jgi:ribonuclease H2 subunit A